MFGKLFLIPAPLADGSHADVLPENVILKIRGLKYFVAEDIRTARRYLSSLKLNVPDLSIEELNEHNLQKDISNLLQPLLEGHDMGILSEAGMPCIADPGEELVNIAHDRNIEVVPLTGPSSIMLALVASGLTGERFSFDGYLPRQQSDLEKTIKKIEQISLKENQSRIFIETPYRNNQILNVLLKVCNDETKICVACNLTGNDEYIATKSVKQWKKKIPDLHKKPCIFVLQAFN